MKNKTILFILVLFQTLANGQCWQSITAGSTHNVAIKTDGTLWAWGSIENGGNVPIQLDNTTNWQKISSGGFHSLALKTDGSLWSWATNVANLVHMHGQLGNGSNNIYSTPLQVGTATDWSFISAGYYHSFAIKNNGTLWACGKNDVGQLGDGTLIDKNVFTQIGTDNDWLFIESAGFNNQFTIGLKTNGTLWGWGSNSYYQLGDGTTNNKITPTQIGTATNWQSISAGGVFVIAIKNDGTLWGWGNNSNSQFGSSIPLTTTIPTQISVETNWQDVNAGANFVVAKKSNGTIWSCGYNGALQQLGLAANGTIYGGVFNQIGTDNNWSNTSSGYYHTVALKNNNSLYSWGGNTSNQLGYATFFTSEGAPRIINCTSLDNEEFSTNIKDFKLFPNPTTDIINIDNTFNKEIRQIIVMDIHGKIVLKQNKNLFNINIQNLENGIYFLQIFSEDLKYNYKLIKN